MRLFIALLCSAFAVPTFAADEVDYADVLRKNGHTYCASGINRVANWLLDQDGATLALWNSANPDGHAGTVIGTKRYSDGNNVVHLTGTPVKDGGCDVAFTVVLPAAESCSNLRETAFKDWKYFTDLQGLPVYDDPTVSTVSVILQSVGSGCAITKMGVFFFSKDDLDSFVVSQPAATEKK